MWEHCCRKVIHYTGICVCENGRGLSGSGVISYIDTDAKKTIIEYYKSSEPAYVDQVCGYDEFIAIIMLMCAGQVIGIRDRV